MSSVEPMFYRPDQVCELLQISLSTLKRRLAEGPTRGGFTRVKIGRSVRIPRREVDALLPKTRRRV